MFLYRNHRFRSLESIAFYGIPFIYYDGKKFIEKDDFAEPYIDKELYITNLKKKYKLYIDPTYKSIIPRNKLKKGDITNEPNRVIKTIDKIIAKDKKKENIILVGHLGLIRSGYTHLTKSNEQKDFMKGGPKYTGTCVAYDINKKSIQIHIPKEM